MTTIFTTCFYQSQRKDVFEYMIDKRTHDDLLKQLESVVSSFIDYNVKTPAFQLIHQNVGAQDDIASLLMLHKILRTQVLPENMDHLDQYLIATLPSSEEPSASLSDLLKMATANDDNLIELRTVFFAYVYTLATWISVSILSASYLSALILSRSLLECLVNLASGKKRGSFKEKVSELDMLEEDERETIIDFWNELCAWSHPYGKWLKTLCPVFASKGPIHHPGVIKEAMAALGVCTDFAFVIAFDRLGMKTVEVRDMCIEYHIDYSRFMMMRRRIDGPKAIEE